MMKLETIKNGLRVSRKVLKKYLPSILTGVGLVGGVTATIVAIKATPAAHEELEQQKKDEEYIANVTDREPKKDIWQRTKIIAKHYWPTATIMIVSGGCIIFANCAHLKREAALAAAYSITQKNLTDLRGKIVEVDGKKKLQQLNDAIIKDEMNPDNEKSAVYIGGGEHRCKIRLTGTVFYSNIEKVNRAEIELQKLLLRNNYASLDNYFDFLELPEDKRGSWASELGWTVYNPEDLPVFDYSSVLDGGVPTYVISVDVEPRAEYWK